MTGDTQISIPSMQTFERALGNEQIVVAVQRELRETVWMASVVFVLSVAGIVVFVAGMAVVVALAPA